MYSHVDLGRVEENLRRNTGDRSSWLEQRSGGTLCFPGIVEMRIDGPYHRSHNLVPFEFSLARRLILEAQYAAENAGEVSQWFISDRSGFDPIVYARRYVGEEGASSLMRMEIWEKLKEHMERSLVGVCEAGADWLVDDRVRLMPEDKKDWVAFHDLFCQSLKDARLDFVVLLCHVKDLQERVQFVLDRWVGTS